MYFETIQKLMINKMKRFLYLFLILPIFFFSCNSTPEAYFHTDTIEPEVGQEVIFINESHNAKRCEWDFGDGSYSTEDNPRHVYTGTGTYKITLTVTSKSDLADEASLTIEVKIPTLLEIEVVEYYDLYSVANASVILYPTLADWKDQTNISTGGVTDADGFVVFSGLDPIVYYVDAYDKNHDNYTLAGEDVGFIRTNEILPHKINRFVAYVDYYSDSSKGSGRNNRTAIVKKLERKSADRQQPDANDGADDWQSLYNRRARQ